MEIRVKGNLDPNQAHEIFEAIHSLNNTFFRDLRSNFETIASQIDIAFIEKKLDLTRVIPFEQIKGSIQLVAEAAKALQPINDMKLIAESYRSLHSLKPVMEAFKEMDKLAGTYIRGVQSQFRQTLKLLREQQRYKEANERYAAIMIEVDWPPVLDIPSIAIYDIIEAYDSMPAKQFKAELDDVLINFYDREQLHLKLEKWRKILILSRRMRILEDIVEGHLEGKYNLTIPTTLSQIEGLIGDINEHRGRMRQSDMLGYLEDLFDNQISKSPYDIVKSLILRRVFEQFEWGDAVSSSISRHAILHGAKTDYGDKISSLKSILLFDYIVYYYLKKVEKN